MTNVHEVDIVETFALAEDGSTIHDASNASVCSDEGLDMSQRYTEALFTGSSLDSEAEEMVTGDGLWLSIYSSLVYESNQSINQSISQSVSTCSINRTYN